LEPLQATLDDKAKKRDSGGDAGASDDD